MRRVLWMRSSPSIQRMWSRRVDAELFSIFLAHLHFGALAIGVVRLIVDHHEVFVRSRLSSTRRVKASSLSLPFFTTERS